MAPISRLFSQMKSMLLYEALQVEGFMRLLMKRRNGSSWTAEERHDLAGHLNAMAKAVPALLIFSLPGGMILLPILAWFMDRRRDEARRSGTAAGVSVISQREGVGKKIENSPLKTNSEKNKCNPDAPENIFLKMIFLTFSSLMIFVQ